MDIRSHAEPYVDLGGACPTLCALCLGGEIGRGGLLIEMCWRLIDVSAPVSGLFRTAVLIAGFTSHREGGGKSIVVGGAMVYSLLADINARQRRV